MAISLAGMLILAGTVAAAGIGLQNPSFENDLDNWVVKTERSGGNREVVYGPGGVKGEDVPCDETPYGICVVGTDTFDYVNQTGGYSDIRTATVTPVHGDKMLRLAGPFDWNRLSDGKTRLMAAHTYSAQQTFTVDPDNSVLRVAYNVFTYDIPGFDDFTLRITLLDEDGELIAQRREDAFSDLDELRSSGWRLVEFDLTPYAGQEVTVRAINRLADRVDSTWTYVDAWTDGNDNPIATGGSATAPPLPGGGEVNLNRYVDPSTGSVGYTVPQSQVAQFPNGCMPLTIDVPIDPGAGTVSNVMLRLNGVDYPMSNIGGDIWRGEITCAASGELSVAYDLTEDGTTQRFTIPLGGLVLIDPQGVVHDKAEFDQAKSAGQTDDEARATAAIEGATARLQRKVEGSFLNVLSGDPGISPNVNPQITGADGLFQWDVSAGDYRVIAYKASYAKVISAEVEIPPPVLDLHIPMVPFDTTITSGPTGSTQDTTLSFGFESNDPVTSTFECRLDGGPFEPCSSPHGVGPLAVGAHTFKVRATDSEGFTDPTPATRSFEVVEPPSTAPPSGDDDPPPSGDDDPPSADDPPTSAACTKAKKQLKKAQKQRKRVQKKRKQAQKKLKKAKRNGKGKKLKKAKGKGKGKKLKQAKKKAKKTKKALKKAQRRLKTARKAKQRAC